MIEEPFSDAERRLLVTLVINAVPRDRGDPVLTSIITKLSGTDTVLVAKRAYPSLRGSDTTERDRE